MFIFFELLIYDIGPIGSEKYLLLKASPIYIYTFHSTHPNLITPVAKCCDSYFLYKTECIKLLLLKMKIPDHADPPFRFMLTHHSGMLTHPILDLLFGSEYPPGFVVDVFYKAPGGWILRFRFHVIIFNS